MVDSHTQSSTSRNRGINSFNNNTSKYMLFLLLFKDFSSFLSFYGTFQTLSNYSFTPLEKPWNQTLACFVKQRKETAVFGCMGSRLWYHVDAPIAHLCFEAKPTFWVTSAIPCIYYSLLWLLSKVIFTFKWAKQRAGTQVSWMNNLEEYKEVIASTLPPPTALPEHLPWLWPDQKGTNRP